MEPLSPDGYLDRWQELHGGHDPRHARLTEAWLRGVYRVGRPLAAAGVSPGAVTAAGVLVAFAADLAAAPGGRWALAAAGLIVLSALLDALDGAVAVIADRATRLGQVLDSVADRAADAAYLIVLWQLDGHPETTAGAGAALVLLEYTRARAAVAGITEIAVVTVGERPTRVILVALAVLAAGIAPAHARDLATAGAAATVVVCVVGWGQLMRVLRRLLR